jgi:hypothetical protein
MSLKGETFIAEAANFVGNGRRQASSRPLRLHWYDQIAARQYRHIAGK